MTQGFDLTAWDGEAVRAIWPFQFTKGPFFSATLFNNPSALPATSVHAQSCTSDTAQPIIQVNITRYQYNKVGWSSRSTYFEKYQLLDRLNCAERSEVTGERATAVVELVSYTGIVDEGPF